MSQPHSQAFTRPDRVFATVPLKVLAAALFEVSAWDSLIAALDQQAARQAEMASPPARLLALLQNLSPLTIPQLGSLKVGRG